MDACVASSSQYGVYIDVTFRDATALRGFVRITAATVADGMLQIWLLTMTINNGNVETSWCYVIAGGNTWSRRFRLHYVYNLFGPLLLTIVAWHRTSKTPAKEEGWKEKKKKLILLTSKDRPSIRSSDLSYWLVPLPTGVNAGVQSFLTDPSFWCWLKKSRGFWT